MTAHPGKCHLLAGIYMLKVNGKNTRARCEICSKLTIKTPERRRSGVFIVNFEHVSHVALAILSLALNMQLPSGLLFWVINPQVVPIS